MIMKRIIFALTTALMLCTLAQGKNRTITENDSLGNKQRVIELKDTVIDAPKMFREMHDIEVENVEMNDADEVFWRCQNLNIKNLKLHGGTYPFMFSSNIRIDGLESDSKYVFSSKGSSGS